MIPRHAGNRISRQRPSNVSILPRSADACRKSHDNLCASTHTARHRVAARQALAEYGQVWFHAEVTLRAAQPQPETRHHFVKNKQRPKFITQLAHLLIEIIGHRAGAAFGPNRLYDDCCRATQHSIEDQLPLQCAQRIGEKLLRVGRCPSRNPHGLQPPGAWNMQPIDH